MVADIESFFLCWGEIDLLCVYFTFLSHWYNYVNLEGCCLKQIVLSKNNLSKNFRNKYNIKELFFFTNYFISASPEDAVCKWATVLTKCKLNLVYKIFIYLFFICMHEI